MSFQRQFKKPAGVGCLVAGNILRCACDDNLTAAGATFRSQINNPVGGLDHIQVVLDHDDGIAVIAQAVQYRQ
jgi:hypothetical protein